MATTLAPAAAIRTALEAILAPADPSWEQSVVDAYVAAAHGEMRTWTEYLGQPEPKEYDKRRSPGRYVGIKSGLDWADAPRSHEGKQTALAAGRYYVNVLSATEDAKREYQRVREAFLTRLGDKIAYIVQDKHADVTGVIEFRRMIEGNITVVVRPSGASFELRVKVMTNYRYGENSANGRLTVYAQYPATFVDARVGGIKPSPLSEEMLGHLISGLALDHKERATRAEIDARKAVSAEKHRLDRLREGYSRLVDQYGRLDYWNESNLRALDAGRASEQVTAELARIRAQIAKLCAAYGVIDPGSKKAALAQRKKFIETLKVLRAKKEG